MHDSLLSLGDSTLSLGDWAQVDSDRVVSWPPPCARGPGPRNETNAAAISPSAINPASTMAIAPARARPGTSFTSAATQ
ncbi:hypothetical protein BH24CHL6_BH24CHL6_16770 [soil metagenome]